MIFYNTDNYLLAFEKKGKLGLFLCDENSINYKSEAKAKKAFAQPKII